MLGPSHTHTHTQSPWSCMFSRVSSDSPRFSAGSKRPRNLEFGENTVAPWAAPRRLKWSPPSQVFLYFFNVFSLFSLLDQEGWGCQRSTSGGEDWRYFVSFCFGGVEMIDRSRRSIKSPDSPYLARSDRTLFTLFGGGGTKKPVWKGGAGHVEGKGQGRTLDPRVE